MRFFYVILTPGDVRMSKTPAHDTAKTEFRLEPVRIAPRWEEWAESYGSSARTLKRWAAHGRERGEECPLDDPGQMPAWWARHMSQRVPPKVQQAAAVAGTISPAVEEAPVGAGETEVQEEIEVREDELGLEKTLERLAIMEVKLSRKATEPGQTKAWLDTVARMGSVAERLRIEATRLGKLLPRDQVEEAIHAFHGPIEREIRLLYGTMCKALGLPPSPDREAVWHSEVDSLFGRFAEEVLR